MILSKIDILSRLTKFNKKNVKRVGSAQSKHVTGKETKDKLSKKGKRRSSTTKTKKKTSPHKDKKKIKEIKERRTTSEKREEKDLAKGENKPGEDIKPLVDFSAHHILRGYLLDKDEVGIASEGDEEKTTGENASWEGIIPISDSSSEETLLSLEFLSTSEESGGDIDYMDIEHLEHVGEGVELLPELDCHPTEEEKKLNIPINNERFEEIDFYCVNRPYAYVKILKDKKLVENLYVVIEPFLTEEEKNKLNFIKETLDDVLNSELMAEEDAGEHIEELIDQIISDYNLQLPTESKKKIVYIIKRDTVGYGKIDALMRDPYIEDISCDGSQIPIFIYHRDYGSMRTNVIFRDEDELSSFVIKLAQKCGKYVSIAEPMLDGTLPGGSRVQATLGTEVTARGSTFTIRKFRAIPFSPLELVKLGTLSPEMLVFLWFAVENGANGIFAGGTGSGKTTTLNAMALFIPREAKIVSIEETREINLPHPNWIPGVTRSGFGEIVADKMVGEIDMYDLLKAALRQRPEYIIVGEIRGREAYVLFQAMATGHTTYSTMHADSPQSLIHRLESKPMNVPRIMIQSLDFLCFHSIVRMKNKRMRKITRVIEIIDIDPLTKEIITNEVFSWDPVTDTFRYSGRSYILEKIRNKLGISRDDVMKELNRRIKLINWLIKKNRISFRESIQVIEEYRERPEELLKKVDRNG